MKPFGQMPQLEFWPLIDECKEVIDARSHHVLMSNHECSDSMGWSKCPLCCTLTMRTHLHSACLNIWHNTCLLTHKHKHQTPSSTLNASLSFTCFDFHMFFLSSPVFSSSYCDGLLVHLPFIIAASTFQLTPPPVCVCVSRSGVSMQPVDSNPSTYASLPPHLTPPPTLTNHRDRLPPVTSHNRRHRSAMPCQDMWPNREHIHTRATSQRCFVLC